MEKLNDAWKKLFTILLETNKSIDFSPAFTYADCVACCKCCSCNVNEMECKVNSKERYTKWENNEQSLHVKKIPTF